MAWKKIIPGEARGVSTNRKVHEGRWSIDLQYPGKNTFTWFNCLTSIWRSVKIVLWSVKLCEPLQPLPNWKTAPQWCWHGTYGTNAVCEMHSGPSPPGHAGEKLAAKRHFDQEVLWKCHCHGKCFRPGLSLKHHGNRLVPCAWHGDFSSLSRRVHQRSAAFARHCSYGRDRADHRWLPTDQRQDGVDCGFEAQRKVSNGGDTPKRPWVAISCHSSSHCKSSVVMWCYMMLTYVHDVTIW